MTSLSILMVLIILPSTVFADCIITDTPYKYEVVCSGYNPLSPPTNLKKNRRNANKPHKAKRVNFEDSGSVTSPIVMSEEESQFMQTRNRLDGYRGKRKSKEQITKKVG